MHASSLWCAFHASKCTRMFAVQHQEQTSRCRKSCLAADQLQKTAHLEVHFCCERKKPFFAIGCRRKLKSSIKGTHLKEWLLSALLHGLHHIHLQFQWRPRCHLSMSAHCTPFNQVLRTERYMNERFYCFFMHM